MMGNQEMLVLIEEFLKQIKNLLFLELTDQIPSYYERFLAIMKEKQVEFGKFEYLKLVFEVYLHHHDSIFLRREFSTVLDQINP